MMQKILTVLMCAAAAAAHLSSASPVLRSALVLPSGANVSLPCNLSSCAEVTWFLLRSEQLLPLVSVSAGLVPVEDRHLDRHLDSRRLYSSGDPRSGQVSLHLHLLQPQDGGLYYCSGRSGTRVHVSRGVRVQVSVDGADVDSLTSSCWSLGVCLLPTFIALVLLFITTVYLCSGKSPVCCCDRPQVSGEQEQVQYSSLRLKPRPLSRAGPGLVRDDVIYSAVNKQNS